MKPLMQVACLVALLPCAAAAQTPNYTADGRLIPPNDYREWIFLSSGLDMSYLLLPPNPLRGSIFGNVFVNPEAYRVFMKTGAWPDKTMFVLEVRSSASKGSINKGGHYQEELVDVEVHLKDQSRFATKWAFFEFGTSARMAQPLPSKSNCQTCHSANGAVDQTFVQFYPTLIPVAKAKGTFQLNSDK